PPGFLPRSQGFLVRGWKLERPDESIPQSGMVVLEKITAPASRKRAAGGESTSDGTSWVVAAPSRTGTPLVAMLSLMVTGTPSSAPIGSPFCQRAVDCLATARAPSGSNAYNALMWGSQSATWASTSSSTSDGENCFARKPAIRSRADRSCKVDTLLLGDLRMVTCRQAGFNDAGEDAGAHGEDLVVEREGRIMHGPRAVMAEPEIGAGHGLQHVGKILAAHLGLRAGLDVGGADNRLGCFRD